MASSKKLTESYKRLKRNLTRGDTLLEEFFDKPGGKVRGAGQPKGHEQELLRAVLVLTVGAIDAFLSDLLVELLPRIAAASPDAAVFDRIAKDNPGLVLRALYLGSPERDAALAEVIEAHFQSKTMHGAKAVRQVCHWCVLSLDDSAFNSTNTSQTLSSLDGWTDKRHQIVHRGERIKLTRANAGDLIKLVESIGKTLNDGAIKALYS